MLCLYWNTVYRYKRKEKKNEMFKQPYLHNHIMSSYTNLYSILYVAREMEYRNMTLHVRYEYHTLAMNTVSVVIT